MSHETEIIAFNKLKNGQMVVTIRCCGNPNTDWNHTMAPEVVADPAKKSASISAARQLAVTAHQNAIDADAALPELMGEKVKHE
jgi:hypothetical protein